MSTTKTSKGPTNIAKGLAIFNEQYAKRTAGEFTDNRSFRASVTSRMQTELGASAASAAAMYNTARLKINDSTLGRDPKKTKTTTKVTQVVETV